MEKLQELLNNVLNIEFVQGIMSNPRRSDGVLKIKVRPVGKKGNFYFQLESFTKTQVFHENLMPEEAAGRIVEYMGNFRQLQVTTRSVNYTVLVSKKGKVTIQKKHLEKKLEEAALSHNRTKKYILREGMAVPFLEDLGIMTSEGKIVKSRFDKFRQMNRFLEFIEDILPRLDKGRELTILDFGCGKSYLTFAMYYYLHELKEYDIRIIGLDLKEDVIEHCSGLARKYGYEKLTFLVGDIADYEGVQAVDMVVTLHACDTATDYALAKAIGWNAQVILSVPCCQHELNKQIANEMLAPIMDYGLLKERFAALVTDGLRAKYLETAGYETQVLEFIDMEHTPKNILLRAVKSKKDNVSARREIRECETFLQVKPTLGKLLYGDEER
ncbi:class I SAM-dependent methyltransferase [Faecalicatena contorta]|uniref:Methyltransferase domain-containing protein n=1 Tax=Faecalicatena contorta TaxID=39482 RepID=A0A315ZV07_9FIRM|nr:SAM-dependent methyltransferase [Faecalicatena contorta]PWJ49152.1 methyltransferase family protein [Faecalicatena contorta]SUQ14857.1 Methyltransferase domain-containing protein [Faecalicatena contorta]